MNFIEAAKEKAARNQRNVILPEGHDPRMQAAAEIIAAEGFAHPVLFGDTPKRGKVQVIDPSKLDIEPMIDAIRENRPKTTREEALERLKDPMARAAGVVATGLAEAMVAGIATPTRDVIRAAFLVIGLEPEIRTASSYFVMLAPGRDALFMADCALNISPDAEQLADIAIATSHSAAALTGRPARTALLSYSTYLSGAGEGVDKVRDALHIVQARHPELLFDGPLQADAALSRSIASRKGVEGNVAGHADTLIFPTLDAGNIGYKLLQELAGAQAVGPFLQGFRKPICDLSRGATVEDIVASAAITMSSVPDTGDLGL
jgi:phosphate acetyltransferase